MKKLDIVDSARLFALVAIATDDAFIAVFEAKYHYNFWRPITAIRNADLSDNPATQRDATWLPLGDTPMHPEYPCAHCITSSAAAAVLQSAFGNDIPEVSMTSIDGTRRDATLEALAGLCRRGRDGAHLRRLPLPLLEHGRRRRWAARLRSSRSTRRCALPGRRPPHRADSANHSSVRRKAPHGTTGPDVL